jgi:hypothetical protein
VSTVSAASIEHREAQGSCEPDSAPLSPSSFDNSPELFAVFHALQSLLTPRHPPRALSSSRGLRIRRGPRVRYRPARNRLEVAVTYRVLPGSEVSGVLGSPLPVRPRDSQKSPALPVFLHPPAPKDATPRAILSWCSALLHGLTRRSRPRSLDRGHLSWGSVAPTALEEKRVHVQS